MKIYDIKSLTQEAKNKLKPNKSMSQIPLPLFLGKKPKPKKNLGTFVKCCFKKLCCCCKTLEKCCFSIRQFFICISLLEGISLVAITWLTLYLTGENYISTSNSKHIDHFTDYVHDFVGHASIILDQVERDAIQHAVPSSLNPQYSPATLKCGMNLACYQDLNFSSTLASELNQTIGNVFFWKQLLSRTVQNNNKVLPSLVMKMGTASGHYVCVENKMLYLVANESFPYMSSYPYDVNNQAVLSESPSIDTKTKFIVQERLWYKTAMIDISRKVWVDISFQVSVKQFAAQASKAIVFKDKVYGAVCVSFNLHMLQDKLKELLSKFTLETYLDIYETNGNLVGSSSNPTEKIDISSNSPVRLNVFDKILDNSLSARAARSVLPRISKGGAAQQAMLIPSFFTQGSILKFYHFETTSYQDDMGLNWILALTMRREFFFESVLSSSVLIFILFLLTICCCSCLIVLFTTLIVLPLQHSADKLGKISRLKLNESFSKRLIKSKEINLKKISSSSSKSVVTTTETGSNSLEKSFGTIPSSPSMNSKIMTTTTVTTESKSSNPEAFLKKIVDKCGIFRILLKIRDYFKRLGFFYEIGSLNKSIDKMEEAMQFFVKYLPVEVVLTILEKKTKNQMLIQRNCTILFSDIANFTSFSETVSSGELVLQLTNYFEICTKNIENVGGIVDKFIGDSTMALYNSLQTDQKKLDSFLKKTLKTMPRGWKRLLNSQIYAFDLEDFKNWIKMPQFFHPLLAIFSAIMMQKEFKKMRKLKKFPFFIRIGISSGNCMIGNVGSNSRLNFTALGDTVNVAARLESLNKMFETGILISQKTLIQQPEINDFFKIIWIDSVFLKGKDEEMSIYAIIGLKKKEGSFEIHADSIESMINESNYSFLIPNSDGNGKRSLKKSKILEVSSKILKTLFEQDKFELMKSFIIDIEPHLVSKYGSIISHWKQRINELLGMSRANYDLERISEMKHLKLATK